MATKVSNFSDLIQRVTASCLLHPLSAANRHASDASDRQDGGTDSDDDNYKTEEEEEEEEEEGEEEGDLKNWDGKSKNELSQLSSGRVMQMEMLLGEVFEAISAMKRAYVSLQDSHYPWDPDRMRVADVAVVAELRRLGVLKERFRRSVGGNGGRGRRKVVAAATLREVVAPYEAAVEELKRDLKVKEIEIDNLKEKLQTAASHSGSSSGGKKGKSKKKVSCISQGQDPILSSQHSFDKNTPSHLHSRINSFFLKKKKKTKLLLLLRNYTSG